MEVYINPASVLSTSSSRGRQSKQKDFFMVVCLCALSPAYLNHTPSHGEMMGIQIEEIEEGGQWLCI